MSSLEAVTKQIAAERTGRTGQKAVCHRGSSSQAQKGRLLRLSLSVSMFSRIVGHRSVARHVWSATSTTIRRERTAATNTMPRGSAFPMNRSPRRFVTTVEDSIWCTSARRTSGAHDEARHSYRWTARAQGPVLDTPQDPTPSFHSRRSMTWRTDSFGDIVAVRRCTFGAVGGS
jgi:hypothetical protein